MLSDGNETQILTQLGLTVLEAKIYVALNKFERLTIKELSNLTKTSRPDTYRVTAKLQEKGLIEKIIKKPAQFKAVPMDNGVLFLLERKSAEFEDLKTKSKLLIRTVKEKPLRKHLDMKNSHFTIIPQRETIVRKIREAIERSQRSVDIVLSWKRFLTGITGAFAESSEKAWDREVKFRIVVESPKEEADVERTLRFCRKSPLCNIRFLSRQPKTVIGIYDNKEVFIIIEPEEGLFDSPALWSDNHCLISAVQDHFEMLWLTSMEEPITFKQA